MNNVEYNALWMRYLGVLNLLGLCSEDVMDNNNDELFSRIESALRDAVDSYDGLSFHSNGCEVWIEANG